MAGGESISAKIIKALGIFTGVQSIGILCSIVRAKLISIWIGTTGVGLFATFNSVLEMMSTATQLNIRESSVRDLSAADGSKLASTVTAVRWWARRLGLAGALVMALLSPLLSLISFGDTDMWWGFCALSVAMFALSVSNGEQAIMQGTSLLRPLAKSTMWGAVGGTVISIPLYYFFGTGSIVPSITIFSLTTMTASCLCCSVKGASGNSGISRSIGRKFLSLGLYLTIPAIAVTAASYVFISYLNSAYSESTTGIFQAGYTLVIRYTGIVFTALSMEYFPRISRTADRVNVTSTLVSHEMILILNVLTPLLVIFISADGLILHILYTEAFIDTLPFVTIGCLAMIFRGASYCMSYVIIARGDGRTFLITELLSVSIGLTLNITLFTRYSFTGLGVSYVLWYLIYTLIVGYVYRGYGMILRPRALRLLGASVTILCAAIVLKGYGWWPPLIMLVPSLILIRR
ncbi:MAG: oligosaccharide flippase family protein [Muribaculaceae bacterium]|nr:oligosaccharide flippase family protein [Muribaculaceae bacterium]